MYDFTFNLFADVTVDIPENVFGGELLVTSNDSFEKPLTFNAYLCNDDPEAIKCSDSINHYYFSLETNKVVNVPRGLYYIVVGGLPYPTLLQVYSKERTEIVLPGLIFPKSYPNSYIDVLVRTVFSTERSIGLLKKLIIIDNSVKWWSDENRKKQTTIELCKSREVFYNKHISLLLMMKKQKCFVTFWQKVILSLCLRNFFFMKMVSLKRFMFR